MQFPIIFNKRNPRRTFTFDLDGERFEVTVYNDGYDVNWVDCPSDEVPSGYSSSIGADGMFLVEAPDAPEGWIDISIDDPSADEIIREQVAEWRANVMTEDGCCAACAEYDAMRAECLLDRHIDLDIDGTIWKVTVWQEVWEAHPKGNSTYGISHERDLTEEDPRQRALDAEDFTDEGIARIIRELR